MSVLHPTGPLPPEIYWRRRALAVGVFVVVLAIIIGLIVWATSGGGKPKNASDTGPITTPNILPSASPQSSDSSGYGDGYGGESSSATPSVVVGPDGIATTVQVPVPAGNDQSGNGSRPASTPEPVPASGLCPDQNISVVLYTDKASYAVGDKPVFTLVVTNTGLQQCTRDVGKGMQNVTVRTLDGTRYIWSANDCSPISDINNQSLKPGQQFKDTIVWSGTTSSPGCSAPRVPVGPGAYQAIAKIGERQSAPITFNVTAVPGG